MDSLILQKELAELKETNCETKGCPHTVDVERKKYCIKKGWNEPKYCGLCSKERRIAWSKRDIQPTSDFKPDRL